VQVEVPVRGGPLFRQGHPAAVRGDAGDLVAPFVLVQELPLVAVDRHLIEVEGARVALVGEEEEALLVPRPACERGLELVARRQVADAAVRRLDEEMGLLVAALVAGVEEALVLGEIALGVGLADLGVGELHGRAAVDRQGVDVDHAGLGAAHQDLAAVRGEGGPGVERGAEELVDRIAVRRGRLLRLRRRGGREGGGRNREDQTERQGTEGRSHAQDSRMDKGPAPIRRGPPLPRAGAGRVRAVRTLKEACAHRLERAREAVLTGPSLHTPSSPHTPARPPARLAACR
jgi:hypothetical protein